MVTAANGTAVVVVVVRSAAAISTAVSDFSTSGPSGLLKNVRKMKLSFLNTVLCTSDELIGFENTVNSLTQLKAHSLEILCKI